MTRAGGRHDVTRRGIDAVLLHPGPILAIQLGPLGAELGAAVAGFHVALLHALAGFRPRAAAGAVPPAGAGGGPFALGVGGADRARGHLLAGHETQETDQDRRYFPRGVEALGVEVGDGEAQASGGLEAPRGSVHADSWRREGVVRREYQRPPVLSIVIGSGRRPGEDVVPPIIDASASFMEAER